MKHWSTVFSRSNFYPFKLLIDAGRQHDAGHDGPQQQDEGVDDPGHRGVPDAWTAAAHQTCCTAAQTWHLWTDGIALFSARYKIILDVRAAVEDSSPSP